MRDSDETVPQTEYAKTDTLLKLKILNCLTIKGIIRK